MQFNGFFLNKSFRDLVEESAYRARDKVIRVIRADIDRATRFQKDSIIDSTYLIYSHAVSKLIS